MLYSNAPLLPTVLIANPAAGPPTRAPKFIVEVNQLISDSVRLSAGSEKFESMAPAGDEYPITAPIEMAPIVAVIKVNKVLLLITK